MPARSRVRVSATEFKSSRAIFPALADAGLTGDEAVAVITRARARLRRALRLEGSGAGPINTDARTVKIEDLAGVIRLAPLIELEVAPKFLGEGQEGWREDFLAIANYTGIGGLLSDSVRADTGQAGDLASMIGRSFIAEFARHSRKPLRLYSPQRWRDFQLDGELDADVAWERSADGFVQHAIVLDLKNPFNAVIAAAAEVLVGEVSDASLRRQLLTIRGRLGLQAAPAPDHLPRLPARHEPWADLIELARHVLASGDLMLDPGRFAAPGFVVRTWEAWERLVYWALRTRLGPTAVRHHNPYVWARRGTRDLHVFPDVALVDTVPHRLVDAKYKTRVDRGTRKIAQSDLMESAAFMGAAGVERIVLVYPRPGEGEQWPCGASAVFDLVTVAPERLVVGIEAEVRGFGAARGHREFAAALTMGLEEALVRPDLALGDRLETTPHPS